MAAPVNCRSRCGPAQPHTEQARARRSVFLSRLGVSAGERALRAPSTTYPCPHGVPLLHDEHHRGIPRTQTAHLTSPHRTRSRGHPVAVNDIGWRRLPRRDRSDHQVLQRGRHRRRHVVKIDKDEVLLDIGYKSEGVIPSRELSIRNDVDPDEVVTIGEQIEALVLQKEDKEGRLILSKKRAQYERAWGKIEEIKEDDGIVEGPSSRSSRVA